MEPFESIVDALVFFFFKVKKKKNEVSVCRKRELTRVQTKKGDRTR